MSARYTVDWEEMIHQEIANRHVTRALIAQTYAFLILRGHRDFEAINRRILARYTVSGWQWIKREAWKRVEQEREQ